MSALPNSDQHILDLHKLKDYCLSASHPRGRHKARVFREALGLAADDTEWLRDRLLEAVKGADAENSILMQWASVGALMSRSRDTIGALW